MGEWSHSKQGETLFFTKEVDEALWQVPVGGGLNPRFSRTSSKRNFRPPGRHLLHAAHWQGAFLSVPQLRLLGRCGHSARRHGHVRKRLWLSRRMAGGSRMGSRTTLAATSFWLTISDRLHPARRRGRVDAFAKRDERHADRPAVVEQQHQVLQVASEPVQTPDDQHVEAAALRIPHERVQDRPSMRVPLRPWSTYSRTLQPRAVA